MVKVIQSCAEFAVVYIENIFILSNTIEHCEHIRGVMLALTKAGLKVKPSKCQWRMKNLEYLGHEIVNGSGGCA